MRDGNFNERDEGKLANSGCRSTTTHAASSLWIRALLSLTLSYDRSMSASPETDNTSERASPPWLTIAAAAVGLPVVLWTYKVSLCLVFSGTR